MGAFLAGHAQATELPIVLVGSARIWKAIEVQKPAAAQVVFETLFTRANSKERFVVLRSSRSPEEDDSFDDFTRSMREAFAEGSVTPMLDKRTTQMGFEGQELQFRMVNPEGTFDCELFSFTHEQRCWAVLHAKPLTEAGSDFSSFGLFTKRPAPPTGVAVMERIKVVDDAISDFPIGFKIAVRAGTNQIGRILVTDVPLDSETSRAGVKVGDEIVTINGRRSTTFSADSGRTGEIGRIFLNRRLGEKVFLELISAETQTSYNVVLSVQYRYTPWYR